MFRNTTGGVYSIHGAHFIIQQNRGDSVEKAKEAKVQGIRSVMHKKARNYRMRVPYEALEFVLLPRFFTGGFGIDTGR